MLKFHFLFKLLRQKTINSVSSCLFYGLSKLCCTKETRFNFFLIQSTIDFANFWTDRFSEYCHTKKNIKTYQVCTYFSFWLWKLFIRNFFWGRFGTPVTTVTVATSAGNSFRLAKIDVAGDIYLYSGHLNFFLICTHQAHYIGHLSLKMVSFFD